MRSAMRLCGDRRPRRTAVLLALLCASWLAVAVSVPGEVLGPGAALAADDPPVSLSPPNGQVFAWDSAWNDGVPLVVQAPAGMYSIDVDVARDPGLTVAPKDVSL